MRRSKSPLERETLGGHIFQICNTLILTLVLIVTLYPCLYVLFASFSDGVLLTKGNRLLLWPKGFQLGSYEIAFNNPNLWNSYLNTILYTFVGTALNIVMTCIAAYVLSRKYLPGHKIMMRLVVFTMYFSGGMIPTYLWLNNLHLIDTFLVMILPGAVSTWNLIILRTAFISLSPSMEESAKIDGASDMVILFKIIVPLCLPSIAVILLYYAVGHWNEYFNALIYLRQRSKFPLQMILRELVVLNNTDSALIGANSTAENLSVTVPVKYAVIVISTLPILFLYPFLQKYFVKGMMVGAVKE